MNIDIVSCIAEFSHMDTLLSIKLVDDKYKDICERNMKPSKEALLRIINEDKYEALNEYMKRYTIDYSDVDYALECTSLVMFKIFYNSNQLNKVIENSIINGILIIFEHTFNTNTFTDERLTELGHIAVTGPCPQILRLLLDKCKFVNPPPYNKIPYENLVILFNSNLNLSNIVEIFNVDLFYHHTDLRVLELLANVIIKDITLLDNFFPDVELYEFILASIEPKDYIHIFHGESDNDDYIYHIIKLYELYDIPYTFDSNSLIEYRCIQTLHHLIQTKTIVIDDNTIIPDCMIMFIRKAKKKGKLLVNFKRITDIYSRSIQIELMDLIDFNNVESVDISNHILHKKYLER